MAHEVQWMGTIPSECDICHQGVENGFIDGKTTMGPWAIMCPSCFMLVGIGLGLGKGQKYQFNRDTGKYIKIAG